MKLKLIVLSVTALIISSCSINKDQVANLAKCDYDVESVQNVRLAGKGMESFMNGGSVNLSSLPAVAMAMLTKDLPLEARVNMKVSNPNSAKTVINSFKYLIEIQGKPLFEGTVDENINLAQGQSTIVPLTFKANIFDTAKENGIDNVLNEIFTRKGEGFLVLKIKPSFKLAGKNIYYPGYITVDKNLAKSIGKLIAK
ncbi:hypothetical protein [Sphingobacterium psychroaquaticum]|uniref:Uncharacterized protein n=1 Tax=Sphingobacterium psychroaquaticum TaxID=561061 RepID=A0A1X7JUS7_9SPHI|nr:hypothetical protein [Sphingobacterium psychroaquaticum]QBQ41151.1 hypothetical protein E2P86_08275 [Sphingobacterium psychroaquaticum]SMG31455.1 hypothetical protein SAMN05660862_2177 [Sphingobacterium psychroaquaticum]